MEIKHPMDVTDEERQIILDRRARLAPKFKVGDAVTVLKPQAILAPPYTRLPGVVTKIGSRDDFACTWDYEVVTAEGVFWGTCNTVRPLTK